MAYSGAQLAIGLGQSMKIGVVCPYDLESPGGVQQLTSELVEKLRASGDDAFLVGAGEAALQDDPKSDTLAVPVGRAIRWRANKSIVPFTISPASWRRVRRALAGADVIHVHEPLIPLVGWTAFSIAKPLVATFHANPARWVGTAYRYTPLLGRRLRKAVVTAVSEAAARPLPKAWGQVSIIPNAIEVALYEGPVQRFEHRVAFLGRDDPRKGLDVLLQAWPAIRESHPDAELIVMGASRLAAPAGVSYLGRVSGNEKRDLLASSSVFVAPNTGAESFGIAIAEAMAAGCAVVVSELPAFKAVVGRHGLVVPPADPEELGEAVNRLLGDPLEARRIGEQARGAVRRFDWGVVLGAYRDAYRRALAM